MTILLLLYALTGGALSSAIMMHVWLLDPPHGVMRKFLGTLVAGAVGGILGGYVVHSGSVSVPQDPIPGIMAAASAGTILSTVVALTTGGRSS
jgi:hypothetical protein